MLGELPQLAHARLWLFTEHVTEEGVQDETGTASITPSARISVPCFQDSPVWHGNAFGVAKKKPERFVWIEKWMPLFTSALLDLRGV